MQRQHTWAVGALLVAMTVGLSGCSLFGSPKNVTHQARQSQTSAKSGKLAKDESIIQTARKANATGHYQASNKALSQINVAELNGKGFGTLKTEFFDLQKSNDKFLLKDDKTSKSVTTTGGSTTQRTTGTNDSFDGYSKFTGDYAFYNDDDGDRIQADLDIDSDGTVIQNNNDGTAFHGYATIRDSGAKGVLSYDVSSGTNDTKTIDANVEIDVTWSNGENETYYGYTAYDGSTVLTDGQSYHHDLVNEVWTQG